MHHNELHWKHQGRRVSERLLEATSPCTFKITGSQFLNIFIFSHPVTLPPGTGALVLCVHWAQSHASWFLSHTVYSWLLTCIPAMFVWSERENTLLCQCFCDGHRQGHLAPQVWSGVSGAWGVEHEEGRGNLPALGWSWWWWCWY